MTRPDLRPLIRADSTPMVPTWALAAVAGIIGAAAGAVLSLLAGPLPAFDGIRQALNPPALTVPVPDFPEASPPPPGPSPSQTREDSDPSTREAPVTTSPPTASPVGGETTPTTTYPQTSPQPVDTTEEETITSDAQSPSATPDEAATEGQGGPPDDPTGSPDGHGPDEPSGGA